MFIHGGHGCAGSYKDYEHIVNRYAVECDATIISLDYRLAPMCKAPAGIFDAYSALLWILNEENAAELGIDLDHVAIFGDGTGAAITMSVCYMLISANELPC